MPPHAHLPLRELSHELLFLVVNKRLKQHYCQAHIVSKPHLYPNSFLDQENVLLSTRERGIDSDVIVVGSFGGALGTL
jgi:hypothetical protein